MPKIFISYRREDTSYQTTTIYEFLRSKFGRENVFMDVDTIPAGVDFREYLHEAVSGCDVLLAVIGEYWVVDRQGNRRLDDARDFVRIELEAALQRHIRLIPVLVGDTTMPGPSDLPESIQDLAFRNAVQVRPGRDLRPDMRRLIRELEAVTPQPEASPPAPPQPEAPLLRLFRGRSRQVTEPGEATGSARTGATYAGLSDVGRVRQKNEDRWFAESQQGLFLVADGVGGAAAGGLAAQVVVEVLPPLLRKKLQGIEQLEDPLATERIVEALAELSDRLRKESVGRPGMAGTGSTVVLALVRGRVAIVAHMGDSRAYLVRRGQLEQLTKDHSLVQLLIDCGEIEPEQAATHPASGQLTRFVGMPDEALPEARLVELLPGDRLLLCSDGLTGMLDDRRLAAILKRNLRAEEACRHLVAAANEAGGKDNVTVVIVAFSNGSD